MDQSNPNSNQDYLTRFIKCIVLSRLYLFRQCYEFASMTPRDWLLIQLRFDCTSILHEARKLTEKDLDSKLKELTLYMQQKNECNGLAGYLPIFLDEAQATMFMYSDFFYSAKGEQNKPLYYGLTKSFRSIADCSLITSGTGLRLQEAEELVQSMANKPGNLIYIVSEAFENHDQINLYLKQFCLEFNEHQSCWFIGRIRFLPSFIENHIHSKNQNLNAEEYVHAITSNDSLSDLSLVNLFKKQRFVGREVEYHECKQLLLQCVCHWIYFGKSINATLDKAWLFELAFGRLIKENQQCFILIQEPLILQTCMNVLFGNDNETFEYVTKNSVKQLKDYFEQRLARAGEPFAEGFSWEYYLSVRMMQVIAENPSVLFGD